MKNKNLISELHESFSYFFTYDNYHRALEIFSWDFKKATMYLIDNGEQVKEDVLKSDDKKILNSFPLEVIRNLSGYYELKEKEENDNNIILMMIIIIVIIKLLKTNLVLIHIIHLNGLDQMVI